MNLLRVLLAVPLLAVSFLATDAFADGCYICGSGSTPSCKNYCRYKGSDTFAARKECEKKGCKVSGTASCPTAVNYKVCAAPVEAPSEETASTPTLPVEGELLACR